MRRLAIVPLLAVGLLAGCAQLSQTAGDLVGAPVEQACTTYADVYAEYEKAVNQAGASADDLQVAWEDLVARLRALADDIGGQAGDLVRQNADALASGEIPTSDILAALTQGRDALAPFCG